MGRTKQSKLFIVTPKTTVRSFKAAPERMNNAMQKGVDMQDLVGTITITEDPLAYQRRVRGEWDDAPLPTPKRKGGKQAKKP